MSLNKKKSLLGGKEAPSHRPLKVGENIRHVLSDIFMNTEMYHPDLEGVMLTITCVKVSPDLRHAIAYVVPLAIQDAEKKHSILKALDEITPQIRKSMASKLFAKYMPELRFEPDTSFDNGGKIDSILSTLED